MSRVTVPGIGSKAPAGAVLSGPTALVEKANRALFQILANPDAARAATPVLVELVTQVREAMLDIATIQYVLATNGLVSVPQFGAARERLAKLAEQEMSRMLAAAAAELPAEGKGSRQ